MHRTAFPLCGAWHRAADLVPDTFVKLFRAREELAVAVTAPRLDGTGT